MIEIERMYLARFIPDGLSGCKSDEIIDIYIPWTVAHPQIRLRKEGRNLVLTKKYAPDNSDFTRQVEQTIVLTEREYEEFAKLDGKKLRKIRHYYKCNAGEAQIDVFKDELEGLVLIDFEFKSKGEADKFVAPDFCLVDVTKEKFIAGGMLCGKSYSDIKNMLSQFGYSKLP